MLNAPDEYDFRPKAGSKLEQMHAGAYPSSAATTWTPGARWPHSVLANGNAVGGDLGASGDGGDGGAPRQYEDAVQYWAPLRALLWADRR